MFQTDRWRWNERRVFLQVLYHHFSPGEVTKGVRSIVGVGFPLSTPRPHTHFIQDVFQLYFTANIWGRRRGGVSQRRNSFWAWEGAPFSSNLITSNRVGVIDYLNQQNGMIFKKKWCCFHGNWCFLTTCHYSGVVVTGINDLSLCQNTQVTVSTLTSNP